jgi:Histones H3 and H4
MASKKILSLSAMEKLMKAAGAYRVSEESKEALRDVLEDVGEKISREANELSRHANRRTIKAGDIKLASKQR